MLVLHVLGVYTRFNQHTYDATVKPAYKNIERFVYDSSLMDISLGNA